ncbi:PEP-CTERM sorting domain-containing protein [Roseateles sp. NT4]|uniref:PEP-CTERM sorting domain-containing protein n=1 Tax=Roseateles sp. NT4 TaxID=3453715 RepID=UPI003EEE8154
MRHRLALLPLALACLPAFAVELSQQNLGATGALVSSCAGMASGSFPIEGGLFDWLPGKSNCNAVMTTTAGQQLATSGAYDQATPSVQADSHGSASYGSVGMYAHFRANANAGFAAAESTAGWTDTWTLTPANSAQIGQNAVLTFNIHLDGVLDGLPIGNSYTRIGTQVWLNNATAGGQNFRVQGQGQGGFPFHQAIDQDLSFSVTVQLGTPFELGIFSRASAGTAGAGPNWFSEASSDFASTLTWQGISGVKLGGNAIAYTLSSQSGIDWTAPYAPVPEPSLALLFGGGLLALALRRRSCRCMPSRSPAP